MNAVFVALARGSEFKGVEFVELRDQGPAQDVLSVKGLHFRVPNFEKRQFVLEQWEF